jgi:hypothetical protein
VCLVRLHRIHATARVEPAPAAKEGEYRRKHGAIHLVQRDNKPTNHDAVYRRNIALCLTIQCATPMFNPVAASDQHVYWPYPIHVPARERKWSNPQERHTDELVCYTCLDIIACYADNAHAVYVAHSYDLWRCRTGVSALKIQIVFAGRPKAKKKGHAVPAHPFGFLQKSLIGLATPDDFILSQALASAWHQRQSTVYVPLPGDA